MAVMRVKFECRECRFMTTDEVEALEHSDAERHCLKVSGEVQPRVGLPLRTDSRAAAEVSNPNGSQAQTRPR